MLYGVTLGCRYKPTEKELFRKEVKERYRQYNLPIEELVVQNKTTSLTNVVAGNLDEADILIGASYDTPTRVKLPNFLYFPLHTDKNLAEGKKEILFRLFLLVLFGISSAVCFFLFTKFSGWMKFLFLTVMISLVFFSINSLLYKKNQVNFNRNSASLAILAQVAESLKENHDLKVAYVFLDRQVDSLEGLQSFYEEKEVKEKQFFLLDCLSFGEKIIIAHQKPSLSVDRFLSIGKEKKLSLLEKLYTGEKNKQNPTFFSENLYYLVSGEVEKGEFVVKHSRTKKDVALNIEQVKQIAETLCEFCVSKEDDGYVD